MRPGIFRLAAAAALATAASSAFLASASAADVVTVRAAAGRTYIGSIASTGDSHVIQLDDFALAGMTITISLKADRSDLEPDLALEDPSAADATSTMTPYRKDGPTKVSVKKYPPLTPEGRWLLRVRGKNGTTGDYKLKITTKPVRSFKGTGTLPASAESNVITVYCPTDASVRLKVSTTLGELQPEYGITYRSDGLATPLAISTRPGQASFVAPVTGDQSIAVNGAGGTEGTFKWSAKLKLPRAPKTPVRVNGAPESYPGPGPLPAKAVVTSGSSIRGIETDGVDLSWREVRITGGGTNANKNSVSISTVKGAKQRKLANNFATDTTVNSKSFAMGPTQAAVAAEDELFRAPRDGTGEASLDTTLGTVLRVLASGDNAYLVRTNLLRKYPLDGSSSVDFTTSAGTIQEACLGSQGVVYVVLQGGDIEVYSQTEAGANDDLLGDLGSQTSATAVAARGRDVFVAVDSGGGNSAVYRVDGRGLLPPVSIFTATNPLTALAVDDANVYVMEDDATDEGRVVQVPRGGGVRQVLVRDSGTGSFTMDQTDLAAAGGYVYIKADVSGTDTILRLKRTK